MLPLLFSRIGQEAMKWAAIAAAVLLAVGTFGATMKRAGRREAEADAALDQQEREKRGRDALAKEKRAVDGLSTRDIIDRLRSRDGDWRGM